MLAALPLVGMNPLPYIVPGVVAGAAVISLGFAGGLTLANYGVSRETGVLSLLPGGASLMPALARDAGADIRYVSLSQYLRLLCVSMTLPLVASLLDAPEGVHADTKTVWWMWIAVPALIVLGVGAGKLLRFPNPLRLWPDGAATPQIQMHFVRLQALGPTYADVHLEQENNRELLGRLRMRWKFHH